MFDYPGSPHRRRLPRHRRPYDRRDTGVRTHDPPHRSSERPTFIYTRQEISITARGSSLLPRQNVKHILKFYIPLLRVVKS
jgi:hypothetical protein